MIVENVFETYCFD